MAAVETRDEDDQPQESRAAGVFRYLIFRSLRLLIVVCAASILVFIAIFVVGDPARQVLPIGSSPEALESFRHQAGLDRPLVDQYVTFVGKAVRGDFGRSLHLAQPAFEVVTNRLPVTAVLVGAAILVASVAGVTMGVTAAAKPGSWIDNLLNVVTYAFTSVPPFWLGLMLIGLVAVPSQWLATSGFAWDTGHLVLPVITLAVLPTGRFAQVTRALMISEATQQYVTTARAKGLGEVAVAFRHEFRNAAMPLITLVFYDAARMFVGDALIVEVVFGLQGFGGLATTALLSGDIYVAQAAVMVAAIVVALLNVVGDAINYFMDPFERELVRSGTS